MAIVNTNIMKPIAILAIWATVVTLFAICIYTISRNDAAIHKGICSYSYPNIVATIIGNFTIYELHMNKVFNGTIMVNISGPELIQYGQTRAYLAAIGQLKANQGANCWYNSINGQTQYSDYCDHCFDRPGYMFNVFITVILALMAFIIIPCVAYLATRKPKAIRPAMATNVDGD
jgi:hypothetical protein